MAIIADPFIGESNEQIASDSFLPEQLPEASLELEPTRPEPPRTIQIPTLTTSEQRIPRAVQPLRVPVGN